MIGHNKPPVAFTPSVKIERIMDILDRADLTAMQKCAGIGLVCLAERNWTAKATRHDLQRMTSAKDKETVFRATKALRAKGVIEKVSERGQAGCYNIIPPKVVDAVIEAYEDLKSGRHNTDHSNNQSGREKPVGISGRQDPEAVGSNRSASSEQVGGINPTAPTSGRVEPDRFDLPASRAPALIENPSGLNTYLEVESEVKKEKGKVCPQDALHAFERYNELAQRVGLPVARSLTPERRRALMKRMNDNGGTAAWDALISNIERSSFLQGENDRGWRVPGLDWLLKSANFTKVIEGTYGNGAHAKEGELDKLRRMVDAAYDRQQPRQQQQPTRLIT